MIVYTHFQKICQYSFLLTWGRSAPCDNSLTTDSFLCRSFIYALFTLLFWSLYCTSFDNHLHIFSWTSVIQYLNSTLEGLFSQIQKFLLYHRCKRSCEPFEDTANTTTSLTCCCFNWWYPMHQCNNNFLLKASVTINFPLSNDTNSPVPLLILIYKVWILDMFRGRNWSCS